MSDAVVRQYGGRLRKLSDDEKLLHFDRDAVASMLEYGVRQAGRRGKITARFFELADLGARGVLHGEARRARRS